MQNEPKEPPPTLGVREPRKPKPPTLSGGAAAPLYFESEPEAEAIAAGSGLTPEPRERV